VAGELTINAILTDCDGYALSGRITIQDVEESGNMTMTLEFKSLADAEGFLTATGFELVPGSCDWRNEAGDDAGCYYAHYGTLTGFRVEINRRAARPGV
jgi:hypothetical protein